MIIDLNSENLVCPKCGCIRFRIDENFEMKPLKPMRHIDEAYDAVNRKTEIICKDCGCIVKEFTNDKLVQINFHN